MSRDLDTLLTDAKAWLDDDPDPDTVAELDELILAAEEKGAESDAAAELRDRFAGTLEFGTAGLRGALGAGPNRMNRVVVSRAAAGLVRYLRDNGAGESDSVVIGYDARHKSDVFAVDTAEIVAGAGLKPLLLPRPLPTPVLAFAVRSLGSVAGVMVTASHNPPQDNGYKVYLGDGSQIVPPADADISARIAAVGAMAEIPRSSAYRRLGEGVCREYLHAAASIVDPCRAARHKRGLHAAPRGRRGHGRGGDATGRLPRAAHHARPGRARPGLPDRGLPKPGGARRDGPRPPAGP